MNKVKSHEKNIIKVLTLMVNSYKIFSVKVKAFTLFMLRKCDDEY